MPHTRSPPPRSTALRQSSPRTPAPHRAAPAVRPATASPAAPSASPSTQVALPYNTSVVRGCDDQLNSPHARRPSSAPSATRTGATVDGEDRRVLGQRAGRVVRRHLQARTRGLEDRRTHARAGRPLERAGSPREWPRMQTLRDWSARVLRLAERLNWLPPLLVRLFVGYFFFETGWGKLHDLDAFANASPVGAFRIPRSTPRSPPTRN